MSPWTDSTDRQLLLTIIHLTAPQLPKWDKVAKLMGNGFTAESTRQHFQKMRKDCKTMFGEPGSAAPGTPTKSTPRKPKSTATNGGTPSKSTGKRKGRKQSEGDEDDVKGESPTKKMVIKAESEDGDAGLT